MEAGEVSGKGPSGSGQRVYEASIDAIVQAIKEADRETGIEILKAALEGAELVGYVKGKAVGNLEDLS